MRVTREHVAVLESRLSTVESVLAVSGVPQMPSAALAMTPGRQLCGAPTDQHAVQGDGLKPLIPAPELECHTRDVASLRKLCNEFIGTVLASLLSCACRSPTYISKVQES